VNAAAPAREMLRAVGASKVGNPGTIRLGIDNHIGQDVTGTVAHRVREEYAVPALSRTLDLPQSGPDPGTSLAEWRENGDAAELYRRADRALYLSKAAGRNRVTQDAA
jgi:GGDEF domain-containing protein